MKMTRQGFEGIPDELYSAVGVLEEVLQERRRQFAKWGQQNQLNGTGSKYMQTLANAHKLRCEYKASDQTVTWLDILLEEVYEAAAESNPSRLREELIQISALAVQWVQHIDRQTEEGKAHCPPPPSYL